MPRSRHKEDGARAYLDLKPDRLKPDLGVLVVNLELHVDRDGNSLARVPDAAGLGVEGSMERARLLEQIPPEHQVVAHVDLHLLDSGRLGGEVDLDALQEGVARGWALDGEVDPSGPLVLICRLDSPAASLGGYTERGGRVLDGANAMSGDPGGHCAGVREEFLLRSIHVSY